MNEELQQLLKNLRLKKILEIGDEEIQRADQQQIPYQELLVRLARAQWHANQERALEWRIKNARLPERWTLQRAGQERPGRIVTVSGAAQERLARYRGVARNVAERPEGLRGIAGNAWERPGRLRGIAGNAWERLRRLRGIAGNVRERLGRLRGIAGNALERPERLMEIPIIPADAPANSTLPLLVLWKR